jgi:hypothetical protein
MTISHDLYLDSSRPVDDVASRVWRFVQEQELLAPDATFESLTGDSARLRNGSWVGVYPFVVNPNRPPHAIPHDLHIAANAHIYFREDDFEDRQRQKDDMVRITLDLLRQLPGDAVLERELEVIWLLRRGGDLFLGDEPKFWTPERRQWISESYQWMPKAFPQSDDGIDKPAPPPAPPPATSAPEASVPGVDPAPEAKLVSGWYADPSGRHQFRWWDGSSWTDQVADGDTTGQDPA